MPSIFRRKRQPHTLGGMWDDIDGALAKISVSTGTPVNALPSKGVLTIDTQPTAGDTMTIGTKVFTFVADGELTVDGDISVGTDLTSAKLAIVGAIDGTDGINTASTFVVASAFSTNDSTLTAIVKGVIGNATVTTETFTAETNVFDGAVLGTAQAGVDGTVGTVGTKLVDATYEYTCTADNTIADTNWARVVIAVGY